MQYRTTIVLLYSFFFCNLYSLFFLFVLLGLYSPKNSQQKFANSIDALPLLLCQFTCCSISTCSVNFEREPYMNFYSLHILLL